MKYEFSVISKDYLGICQLFVLNNIVSCISPDLLDIVSEHHLNKNKNVNDLYLQRVKRSPEKLCTIYEEEIMMQNICSSLRSLHQLRKLCRQGEKVLIQPTTNMKLRTSSCWVGTRTGAGVTSIGGSLPNGHLSQVSHQLQARPRTFHLASQNAVS